MRTDIVMVDPQSGRVAACFKSINEASRTIGVKRKCIAAAVRSSDSLSEEARLCCGFWWDILLDPARIIDNQVQAENIDKAKKRRMGL